MPEPPLPTTWPRIGIKASNLQRAWIHDLAPPEDVAPYHILASTYPVFAEGQIYYCVASGNISFYQGGAFGPADYASWAQNLYLYACDMQGVVKHTNALTHSYSDPYPKLENQAHFREGQDFIVSGRAVWWLDMPTKLDRPFYAFTEEGDFAPHQCGVRRIPLVTPT